MKKNILFIVAFVTFFMVSCKDDKKEIGIEKAEDKNEFFSVDLDVVCPMKDDFSLYYTEDNTINFTGEKAVWSGVEAKQVSQKVALNLPGQIIPTNIRIDFGMNKDQGDIILEKFKLSYYGKSFEAKGSDFLKYFIQNDSVKTEIDPVKGTIKFLKNPKKFQPPFYYPQQAVLDEIIKITK